MAEVFASGTPVLEAVTRLSSADRRLVPVEDDLALADALPETVATLADPDRPWPEAISFDNFHTRRSARRWIKRWPLAAALLAAVALVLAWRYTPLADWTRLDQLVAPMQAVAASPWAPGGYVPVDVEIGEQALHALSH